MGDGVREDEDPSEGEGVMEPSSEPRADSISSVTTSAASTDGARSDARVTTLAALSSLRSGFVEVAMRCLGASGGLLAAGVKSMMGVRATSQLYCRASSSPRSMGIHVPVCESAYEEAQGAGRRKRALTLVLSIATLHLLVLALLNLALKDAGSLRLVKTRNLQDLGRIQPRVGPPPHNSDPLAHPEIRLFSTIALQRKEYDRRTSHRRVSRCMSPAAA